VNGMVIPPRYGLSLCAGGGGLDMGLKLAEPGFATACYVEWEEYPRASIIAAQRAGYFAPAPIWDDLKSFDAHPWSGVVDTVLAGYPCQPFSQAGQRRGEDDPRHLWPHVARIIRECHPRWVFLENVPGHVTLGAESVLRELWHMGWAPAVGLFSAQEVGFPHERLRWFCVAYRQSAANGHTPLPSNRRARDRAASP
jgi:DNA (cytosine-5)-methyltransferase 1